MIDDVGLPVPARRVDLERAEKDIAGCVFGLGRAFGVEVGDVDDFAYVVHGGGVDGYEELEAHLCGGAVEYIESMSETRVIVGVVDGEGVEARGLCHADIGGVVQILGRDLDQVVGEDHGGGRTLGQMRMVVRVKVRV